MGFLEKHWHELLGVLIAVAGIVGFIRGGLIASLGEGDGDDEFRMVEGRPARLLSIGYVMAGAAFFFAGPIFGIPVSVVVLALTWALGKSAD